MTADSIVPDPLRSVGWNQYNYVGGNPLKYIDPSGHCWGPLRFLRNVPYYDTTCANLDNAILIAGHPNATPFQKAQAVSYVEAVAVSHIILAEALVIGGYGALLEYGVIGGEAYDACHQSPREETSPSFDPMPGIRGASPGAGDSGGPTAGKPITSEQRQSDLKANQEANPRGNYWCTNCGYENTDPSHFDDDHIIPKSQEGNTTPENRRILCIGCNRSSQEGWPPKEGSDWATKHSDWDMRPK